MRASVTVPGILVAIVAAVVVLLWSLPVTEVGHDHPCPGGLEAPEGGPCPTPAFPLSGGRGAFDGDHRPPAHLAPLCDAIEIVTRVVRPTYLRFEATGGPQAHDAAEYLRAGDQVSRAGMRIEQLVGASDPTAVAQLVRSIGQGFREDGMRMSGGDLDDWTARARFAEIYGEYSLDCGGPRSEGRAVTRGHAAEVIADALDLAPSADDHFADDDGHPNEPAIAAVAAVGLMSGCGEDRFCPDGLLSRGAAAQMWATYLHLPPTDVDAFDDDDASPYEPFINRLAAAGLVTGHRSDGYRPHEGLTLGQLELMLERVLGR